MKNFDKSDYALNKFSEGIVYKFSNEIREITKEQYLRENPNKTEGDFLKLKEISDEIFLDEIRYETAQGRKLVPTEDLENDPSFAATPVDEQYIQKENNEQDKAKTGQAVSHCKAYRKTKKPPLSSLCGWQNIQSNRSYGGHSLDFG